ncbi:hypothetical protein L2E82_42590 [Cichorium intybus]|uniref:Uncharacterized protein n=1 Tax=Cichorium intybus TaxID=13427 RepID=A0ACB8ZLC6_CICIN|nr:hypothetical protein L2E82_42590 [Cichorium intybus]
MKRRKNGEVMVFITDFRYDHYSGDPQDNYDEEELFGTEFVAGEYDSPGDGVAGAGDRRQYWIEESHLNRTRASVPRVWETVEDPGFK